MRADPGALEPFAAGNVSAVVSVRIDSPKRLKNLATWCAYLRALARDIELVVVEQDAKSRLGAVLAKDGTIRHLLIPSGDSHWKTRNLNMGAKIASRPVLMLIDCDVLLPAAAMRDAVDQAERYGGFVQPFNGVLVELREEHTAGAGFSFMRDPPHFPRDYDSSPGRHDFSQGAPIYGGSAYRATGGAIVCDRRDYFLTGGYNENFVSYGFEDMEFFERVTRLGYEIRTLDGCNAYHLPHPRGADSRYNNYYRANEEEYRHVLAMRPGELRRYALNGFRELRFEPDRELRITQGRHHYHVDLKPDIRISLDKVDLVFVVIYTDGRHSDGRLERVFEFLERHFSGYRVALYELGGFTLRHPLNMKNYIYTWLDSRQCDEAAARELAAARIERPYYSLELVDRNYSPAPLMERLQRCLHGSGPADCFAAAAIPASGQG